MGDPSILPFELQFVVCSRVNILVAADDQILSIALLFMEEGSVVFEMTTDRNRPSDIEHVRGNDECTVLRDGRRL